MGVVPGRRERRGLGPDVAAFVDRHPLRRSGPDCAMQQLGCFRRREGGPMDVFVSRFGIHSPGINAAGGEAEVPDRVGKCMHACGGVIGQGCLVVDA